VPQGGTRSRRTWLPPGMDQARISAWLCVRSHARKIQHDAGLVSDCPAVMSCRDRDDVTRINFKLGTVEERDGFDIWTQHVLGTTMKVWAGRGRPIGAENW
jgi:hypothetical protein